MGKFLSVALALVAVCSGHQIFRETSSFISGPLVALYIFMTALFLLLYDLRLYPKSLRKLDGLSQTFVEFLLATFLMENIMMDFWIPLLTTITQEVIPNIAEVIEETLVERDLNCNEFCEFLKSDVFALIVTYIMSIFFLIAVLHAIRAIDLRAMQDGPGCFFGDIFFRVKRFFRKKLRSVGFGGRKRVKIRENTDGNNKSTKHNRSNHEGISSKRENPCLEYNNEDIFMDDQEHERNYDNDNSDDNDSCEALSGFDLSGDL